jgi:predicted DNA repair protein MutK
LAGTSLLTLIDDIATLLDDVALLSKVAAKKTVGLLGDDLALNAEQVSGIRAERELPVVWAVAKGSAVNKLILVPVALTVSVFIPWLITPVLMLGGAYLCFEGFEKVYHTFFHQDEDKEAEHKKVLEAVADPTLDLVAFEKKKIKGAIRTDFILSAEIIVIALGAVQEATLLTQVMVVSGIAALITVGVYGVVAGIVKLDDAGLYLIKSQTIGYWGVIKRFVGKQLLLFAPYLMKGLSIVGTAAMFLVGGGILVHGMPYSHEVIHTMEALLQGLPLLGDLLAPLTDIIINAVIGIVAGAIILAVLSVIPKSSDK